jgi:cation transport regulator ChaB
LAYYYEKDQRRHDKNELTAKHKKASAAQRKTEEAKSNNGIVMATAQPYK